MSTSKTARRQCGCVCKRCGTPRVLIAGGYTVAAPADGTRPPVVIAQVRRVQL